MKENDDVVFVQDDRVIIPDWMMKMSAEELEAEIKKMETALQQKKKVALHIG